ncbi:MAG: hypothetical protein K2K40_10355, partial [Paramuribaculum sp.]|nr:hypothetical protein [Paramuribaculum sp.]
LSIVNLSMFSSFGLTAEVLPSERKTVQSYNQFLNLANFCELFFRLLRSNRSPRELGGASLGVIPEKRVQR